MNVLSFSDKFKRARYYGNVANKSLYSASRLMKLSQLGRRHRFISVTLCGP